MEGMIDSIKEWLDSNWMRMVAVAELGNSSVDFKVRPWVKTADYWDVLFELTKQVKLRFDAEGISIPFPQQDVHIYQEPTVS